jgi:hypothetical protein
VADVLQLIAIMANQNQTQTQSDKPQGDNRQAGDVDGNRGADPKKGTQGVNKSAGNQPDGTKTGEPRTGEPRTGDPRT